MPIEFTCTGCQKTLRVSDAAAGKRARCPDCGQIGSVPMSGGFASSGQAEGGTTWSTGEWAPNEPAAETGNPFASPHGYAQAEPLSRADVSSKISAPAIALIVISSLNLLIVLLQFVAMFADLAVPGHNPNRGLRGADVIVPMAFMGGFILIMLLKEVFVIFGAVQMKSMQSYSMAMTATILTLIPCNSMCCLVQLPLGIWALVTLLDNDVKDAFRSVQAH